MSSISNEPMTKEAIEERLSHMDDSELTVQALVQQGAIHAVSYILQNGCTESLVTEMLASLRNQAELIRQEEIRRGQKPAFDADQTGFN